MTIANKPVIIHYFSSLPRNWVSEVHWPRSLGFSPVLQGAPRLPPSAPRFYHEALCAWKALSWIQMPAESLLQLESTPLWDNEASGMRAKSCHRERAPSLVACRQTLWASECHPVTTPFP